MAGTSSVSQQARVATFRIQKEGASGTVLRTLDFNEYSATPPAIGVTVR